MPENVYTNGKCGFDDTKEEEATNNMFSLSKVTIYIVKDILKYIDFMISGSIPFTIMYDYWIDSCYKIAHNVLNVQTTSIYSI